MLQAHSKSLEELTIAYNNGPLDYSDLCFSKSIPSGTFSNYLSLKKLAIPEAFLVHFQGTAFHKFLPPSLEYLQLQYAEGVGSEHSISRSYRAMRTGKLVKSKNEFVPRLRVVL